MFYNKESREYLLHDSHKCSKTYQNFVHQKRGSYVDMKKQKIRKFKDQLPNSEAFDYIARENARAEYLKKLLN